MEVLLLLPILAIVVLIWILPSVSVWQGKIALRALTARTAAEYNSVHGGRFPEGTPSTVVGVHRSKSFSLSTNLQQWLRYGYGPSYQIRRLKIEVRNARDAKLSLLRTAQGLVLLKTLLRKSAIPTGNADFDRRIRIDRSIPRNFARKLLASSELRRDLLEVLKGMRRQRIDLDGQYVTFEETLPWYYLERPSTQVDYLQRLIHLMTLLAETIDQTV